MSNISFDPAMEKRIPLFQAAEPLFHRYGYKKTTIEDVCRDAGMSKRTFYELFPDKLELVRQLLFYLANDLIYSIEKKTDPSMSSLDTFRLFIEHYVQLGRDHPVFHTLANDIDLIGLWGKLTDRASDIQYAPLINLLKDILQKGIDRGEFRPHDTDTAVWIIYGLLKMMYFLAPSFKGNLTFKGPMENARIAEEINQFLIHAILARP